MFEINKKHIITIILVLFCIVGYVFFPTKDPFQYKAAALMFLVLLPFLYNKYLLKGDNFFKKISFGDWQKNSQYLGIGLIVAFLIIAILFKYTDLAKHYLLSPLVKNNFGEFLWYELTGVAFTVATYELFFRGFIMDYFVPFSGKWAILIQFLFFLVMIMLLGLPYWFYVTYLIFTPIAGWIAYKSDSILYSFVGQLFFIIIVDAVFIALSLK